MIYQLNISIVSPTGALPSQLSATGNTNVEENLTIAASASNAETDITIVASTLQAFYLFASAAMTCVFKSGTGGSGTTEATFTLLANVPQFWFIGNGANPFGGNAGQMLVTSTAGGTLNLRALSQN